MFWRFISTTRIDTLLEKEDVTLAEILDEDDVLQECKAQNKKLIDFLTISEHIEELVNMVIRDPDPELDEKAKYKYPNTACELLTSDVPQVTEKLANEEGLLNKVYAFLESEGPLNPLQASFFSKVMGLLITRKSELMVDFLKSKEDFVGHLLNHIGVSAVMDLLLRLITCIESSETRTTCISWLNEQSIIQKLIGLIDAAHSEEKQCNAAQSLCDIVLLSREQMSHLQERADPDPLLASIESQETICDLLSHMFDGEKVESVMVNGLAIIQTLLEFRKIGPEGCQEQMTPLDAERLAQGVRNTLNAIEPRLKDFHQLLLEPPKQHYQPMVTTLGELDPPLGNTRLQVCRLVSSLLLTNSHSVNSTLTELGTVNVLLDLYFKYVWNNFLHTQVELCLATILSNNPCETDEGKQDHPLLRQLLVDFKLLERILDSWEDNDQQSARPGGRRRGYMGHLTKVCNHIIECREKGTNSDRIKDAVQELSEDARERWDTFVSGALAETNKQNTVELVGSHIQSSSEDDDADFRDIPFPQDSAMQQFGFNEDEFNEQEERVDAPFTDRISSINFDINVDDSPNSASLFEQACNERMQQFDDQDNDEDLWETKEITFAKPAQQQPSSSVGASPTKSRGSDDEEGTASDGDSDSSEEDLASPRRIYQTSSPKPVAASTSDSTETMEVDSSENWANFDEIAMDSSSQGPVAMETNTPWDNAAASSTSDDNGESWAKFDSTIKGPDAAVPFVTDFSNLESNLAATAPELRGGSVDVEMESSEPAASSSTTRTSSYLLDSAPADLASSVEEIASSSTDSVKQSSPPLDPRVAWAAALAEHDAREANEANEQTPTSSTANKNQSSSHIATCQDDAAADGSGNGPDSSADSAANSHLPTNSDPAISSSSEVVPEVPRLSSIPSEHINNEVTSGALANSLGEGTTDDKNEDDELCGNFNFLASAGLMSSQGDAAVDTDTNNSAAGSTEVSSSSPDSDAAAAAAAKVDEIRNQAKEALEAYESATNQTEANSTTTPPTHNGPV